MYEWRKVLLQIDVQLRLMKMPDDPVLAGVIARAIHKFEDILLKVDSLADLIHPTAWSLLYADLTFIGNDFKKLADENQSTNKFFMALRKGLIKGVISRQRWMETPNENKDDAIQYILQQIGTEIILLQPENYNGISTDGKAIMERITYLLLHGY